MKRQNQIKILLSIIFLGIAVLLFSLSIRQYQVLTSSRADEGITPTIPTAPTATPTPIRSQIPGFTDLPGRNDDTYTVPFPASEITDETRQAYATLGSDCNVDKKECKGWAWKFICTVDPNIKWDPKQDSSWPEASKSDLYNRHCTKKSGTIENRGVMFQELIEPEDSDTTVAKLDDVGCGKLVQIDVTVRNCEPGIQYDESDGSCDSGGANIKEALVYYTGACALPTPTFTIAPSATAIPTETPTVPPEPTITPTGTLTPSPLPTETPIPTETPTPTITLTPTLTSTPAPTNTPVPTNTPLPTPTQGPQPTYAQQPTYTPQPTYIAQVQPTSPLPPQNLTVNEQPPGITPWLLVLVPIGLILVGFLL